VGWRYLLLAIAAGVMLPFQAGVNAELAHWVNSPFRAAFVSFLVGTLVLLVVAAIYLTLAVRLPFGTAARTSP